MLVAFVITLAVLILTWIVMALIILANQQMIRRYGEDLADLRKDLDEAINQRKEGLVRNLQAIGAFRKYQEALERELKAAHISLAFALSENPGHLNASDLHLIVGNAA